MSDLLRGMRDWRGQVMMATVGFLTVVLVDVNVTTEEPIALLVVLRVIALALSGALLFIAGALWRSELFARDLRAITDESSAGGAVDG